MNHKNKLDPFSHAKLLLDLELKAFFPGKTEELAADLLPGDSGGGMRALMTMNPKLLAATLSLIISGYRVDEVSVGDGQMEIIYNYLYGKGSGEIANEKKGKTKTSLMRYARAIKHYRDSLLYYEESDDSSS
ncbi:MAG: hypothetical protein COA94_02355 [Rickettsiales bacterium]|nr:MAG: hypothetical protein COA94_02355 [Rickettsiales bacterium]